MHSNTSLETIVNELKKRSRFLVLSHFRPDGDAIGCALAMGLCLLEMGKDVSVWNEDGLPERFEFLDGASLITTPPATPQSFDVVILLDTAVRNRAGANCLAKISPGAVWMNIDHHISNDMQGDFVYIDSSAPAAGQILAELFSAGQLPVTRSMATALYVAISTDTGSFRYPNTTARTYEIAADLVRRGVDVGSLNQALYETNPRRRLELLRALLNALHFSSQDKVASFSLTLDTARSLGTIPDDTEGLIDTIRSIEGVLVAAFFEELEPSLIRLSLRSKNPSINVQSICAEFGGGGHTLASGARIAGSLASAQERVLAAIERHLPNSLPSPI